MDYASEYAEAVAKQNLIRDLAFAGDGKTPLPEAIGPFEVMPMTMRHFIHLRLIGSPFVCGGGPAPKDAIAFLWQLNPAYSRTNRTAKRKFTDVCRRSFDFEHGVPLIRFPFLMKRWAKRAVKRLEMFATVLQGITGYLEESMMDSSGSSEGERGPSYFSDAAAVCHRMAKTYNWPLEYTMDRPFKVSFQLMKLIDAEQKIEAKQQPFLFNRLSDEITAKSLIEDTERMRN